MVFRTILRFSSSKRIPLIKFRRQRADEAVTASLAASSQQTLSAPTVNNNNKFKIKAKQIVSLFYIISN